MRRHRAVRLHHHDGGFAGVRLAARSALMMLCCGCARALLLDRGSSVVCTTRSPDGVDAGLRDKALGFVRGGVENRSCAQSDAGAVRDRRRDGLSASSASACVIAPVSTMARSTMLARCLRAGEIAARREARTARASASPASRPPASVSFRRRLAEIDMRRAVHAIGARAEIDAVEIEFQDLLLATAISPAPPRRSARHLARMSVRSELVKTILAVCWVMVEPPATTWPAR